MRRILAAVAILALALPGAAFADEHGRGHGHHGEAREHGRGQAEAPHGRGHGGQARGHFERVQIAENRDRRDYQRGRNERGDRGRHFTFRGREYVAVRAPAYRYPRGWNYRAWHRGDVLPRLFIAAPYFVDYGYLGLPPAPPGTRWVRYGPDALMIDLYDDHIVDVIYDAFY